MWLEPSASQRRCNKNQCNQQPPREGIWEGDQAHQVWLQLQRPHQLPLPRSQTRNHSCKNETFAMGKWISNSSPRSPELSTLFRKYHLDSHTVDRLRIKWRRDKVLGNCLRRWSGERRRNQRRLYKIKGCLGCHDHENRVHKLYSYEKYRKHKKQVAFNACSFN